MKKAYLAGAAAAVIGIIISSLPISASAAAPAFVQERDARVATGKTVTAAPSSATTAGNVLVVYAVWDNTGTAAITDSQGDAFVSAAGPTAWNTSKYTSQTFYAKNIHGGADTVTGTFGTAAKSFAGIYVLEYSGVSQTAPFDVKATASGTSGSLNSGSATTTSASDLLFAAGVSMNSVTTPGTGYISRSTANGDLIMDKDVTATGSYNATAANSGGAWAMQMTAFKAATTTPDTTAPSVPAGLSATAVSSSQINLAWTASTDNVGVAGYKVYRNGSQVATSTVTSFSNTGLAASTTYSYTVAAYDAAGNVSAKSATSTATTFIATVAPSISSFTASPSSITIGSSTVLSWAVSGTPAPTLSISQGVGTVTGTSVSVSPTATTTYVLTASNSAGTTTASVTVGVHSAPDTVAPSIPAGLSAAAISTSQINLAWTASTDNVGVTGYKVFRNSAQVATTTLASFSDTGLTASTTYSYAVAAFDAAGNISAQSSSVSTSTLANTSTTTSGTYTTNFPVNENPISESGNWTNGNADGLDWANVQTAGGVAYGTESGSNGFDDSTAILKGTWSPDQSAQATVHSVNQTSDGVWEEVELRLRSSITAHSITGYEINFRATSDGSQYTQVVRWNGALNDFTYVDSRQGPGIHDGDVVKATMVGNLITVYINGAVIFTATDNTFTSGNPGMGFYMQGGTAAQDSDYGFSSYTATGLSSTSTPPDTSAPSVPNGLTASPISSSQINVAWNASTDNVGVAGYKVYRNGSQVATSTVATFSDSGLTASTTYSYAVAAYDAAGNVSALSGTANATTTGTATLTPPVFIQTANNQISSGTQTSTAFASPTAAGNTIVAYAIWDNAGSATLTDTKGDTFTAASAPVTWGSGYRAQVFYATSIAGGPDTVTAAYQNAVSSFGVLYVHEYSGIDPVNPLDVTASASGASSTLNSGSATTTSADDLIFGAGVSDNFVTAAGSGFASRNTAYGNITEDHTAATAGSYSATATHSGSAWGMEMVAFKPTH